MGLDSVDLLVKIEKTFSISISDHEAEEIETVGELHNAVWGKLDHQNKEKCISQSLFYKIRQYVFDNFKFQKKDFLLSTNLNDVFPKENRKDFYLKFSKNLNLEVPNLTLNESWGKFLNYFGVITILGGLLISAILIIVFDYTKWSLVSPILGIILTTIISKKLEPLRTTITPSFVLDFTPKIVSLNYSTLSQNTGISRIEMESIINYLIADAAGLEIHFITPDKKICHDLGID
ncbi:hypothetical protein [Emticicia sp. W12TSBA100-4]|uniref:hypothetical protein n=1 Tax=Emticicia sp. W12TSBA100-4 TaxID=3160965 RepID=UPI003305B50C